MSAWLSVNDEHWATSLEQFDHDFYHLPGYTALDANESSGEGSCYVNDSADASLLVPLIVKPIPVSMDSRLDAHSPYGYGGPLFLSTNAEANASMLAQFTDAGADRKLVTSYLRLHPILNPADSLPQATDRIKIFPRGKAAVIDLSRSIEDLDSTLAKNHSRDVRKLVAKGFEARVNHWDDYAAFVPMYTETMTKVAATDSYFFDQDYFQSLKAVLGDKLNLVSVVSPDNEIAAAALFTQINSGVQYHLGATNFAYRKSAPSKLIFYTVRQFFKDNGATWLNLGSGLGGAEDSLFKFKKGFATDFPALYAMGIIHDPEHYSWLNKQAGQDTSDGEFFPAYRAS